LRQEIEQPSAGGSDDGHVVLLRITLHRSEHRVALRQQVIEVGFNFLVEDSGHSFSFAARFYPIVSPGLTVWISSPEMSCVSSRRRSGRPVSMGNVPKCIGTT